MQVRERNTLQPPWSWARASACEFKLGRRGLHLLTCTRTQADPLIHHGRHFGRTVFTFANVHTLLLAGLNPEGDSTLETQQYVRSPSTTCSIRSPDAKQRET